MLVRATVRFYRTSQHSEKKTDDDDDDNEMAVWTWLFETTRRARQITVHLRRSSRAHVNWHGLQAIFSAAPSPKNHDPAQPQRLLRFLFLKQTDTHAHNRPLHKTIFQAATRTSPTDKPKIFGRRLLDYYLFIQCDFFNSAKKYCIFTCVREKGLFRTIAFATLCKIIINFTTI